MGEDFSFSEQLRISNIKACSAQKQALFREEGTVGVGFKFFVWRKTWSFLLTLSLGSCEAKAEMSFMVSWQVLLFALEALLHGGVGPQGATNTNTQKQEH